MENDGDRHDDRKFLERVKKLILLASKSFHSLNVFNHWNIPSYHGHVMAKVKGSFDNCGREHYSPDCPYPHDESKIKKAEEERAARRGGGGRNGGYGGGHGGGRGGIRQGDHKKWIYDIKDGYRNVYGNGVQKRVSDWMCYFRRKECG